MDVKELRVELARLLRGLDIAIENLVDALAHEGVWTSLREEEEDSRSPIRRACEAFAAIDYATHNEAEQSIVCIGAMGITPDMMERVHNVNTAKQHFKTLCSTLHRTQVRVPVKGGSGTAPAPLTRVLLGSIQRSEINLLAAYRKIPILEALPNTITYTVAHTRAVYRKTIEQVDAMLNTRDHPSVAQDRSKLAELPRHETHLAITKEHYVNYRANVLYARLDPRGRGRAQFAAELPLMFVMRSKDPPPIVTFPAVGSNKPALSRQRKKIVEDTPFLESLSVYRYVSAGNGSRTPR